ncbi:DUF7255 family protein [Arthrobacter sp. HMWF013]|uniref:DUF7255 family protein n=1 Tax=Arthrobacter sp. HMWF013 TaxID=2056849 RepID=UPI000D33F820|nr:hypothetical protein [Arthrobacter sp. HMWF013]PTT66999.1 hypothetical protein DBR22_09805 [Arthrobacter sp. HMWF013]
MGKKKNRAETFRRWLTAAGYEVVAKPSKRDVNWAATRELPGSIREEILGVYLGLNGVPDERDFVSGAWDFQVDGALLVEFDEDLHFNRYRASTIPTGSGCSLPWASSYGLYSIEREDMCLRAGKHGYKWANEHSDAMFGGSDSPGEFVRLGASRWKQRALYDAVKDAYAAHTPGVSLARVSIHDDIGGVNVNWAAQRGILLDSAALRDFIETRTTTHCQSSTLRECGFHL